MVPGIVYGKGTEPTKIAFENKVLLKLMHTGAFYSTILDLSITLYFSITCVNQKGLKQMNRCLSFLWPPPLKEQC